MEYDFSSLMDRRGMDALAVDALGKRPDIPGAPEEGFDPIPMWVADMNFPTVPAITDAIIRRASHPAFGYFEPRQEYFDAIIRWQQTHNGVLGLKPEHIGYANGVLGGVVTALNVLCSRGDNVLVHSPTYVGFTHALENNGYTSFTALSCRTAPVSGEWILRIWNAGSRKIRSTPLFFAPRITPAAEFGSAGRSNRPWRFTKNTMST